MQKTYWWRTSVLLLSIIGVVVGYIVFYPYKYGLCVLSAGDCIFSNFKKTLAEPLFLFSIFIFATSLFLFFINDKIFLKWLRFAVVWIILSIILIALTPEYSGGWISMNPDREMVSIWLGSLFVILSLVKIIWDSIRQKRDNNI